MLAYIFWHRPWDYIEAAAYERDLIGFHETLAGIDLEGFRGSATFRVEGAPWVGPVARGYEDWYLLEGSFALDPLNEFAVSGNRKDPHDKAAGASASGAGGLYRLRSGGSNVLESHGATWLTKQRSMGYEEFYARIEPWTTDLETSLWRRQMVLGPAPEFCMMGRGKPELPADLEPLSVERTLVWPLTEASRSA